MSEARSSVRTMVRAPIIASPFHPGTSLPRHVVPADGFPIQVGLDELGTPLSDVTFVVFDLETTGMRAGPSGITEIGAVKVRGGQVLGEFQTLVNPGMDIPPFITHLTGISNAMVAGAPAIADVLPSLWEFIGSSVLVAHNASFDVSFLRAAGAGMDIAWPGNQVVDTLALARTVVSRDEAPNRKLGTLARLFDASVSPDHRALSDARATVDVLHALLGRMAPWGITHLEDLKTATDPVAPAVRAKRHMADALPTGPGVYLFRAPNDDVLYVGYSVNVRKRVRSYFTAAEKRSKMREMLTIAERVTAVACSTVLEARVRELRLIDSAAPVYNRRSKFPKRMPWIRLSDEPHPRLSIVVTVAPSPATHIGPFPSRRTAVLALGALEATFALRECRTRLPLVATPAGRACHLAELGRCNAPCIAGEDAQGTHVRAAYAEIARAAASAMGVDPGPVVTEHNARMATLVGRQDFEGAAALRDQLVAFLAGAHRAQRFGSLGGCAQLIAARASDCGGWEIIIVRYGRLAATALAARGTDPYAAISLALATAEVVEAPVSPATAAHPEETDLLLSWLDQEGVRLVEVSDPQTCPVKGAGAHASFIRTARAGRDEPRRPHK